MEPLRDPNPSDLLEVREPSELVVPQGLSRLSYNLPEHLITSSSINPGCGWGAEVGDLALGGLIPVWLLLQNLDDSVFSKRHAKLELDEKRRKRWEQKEQWGSGVPVSWGRVLEQGARTGCS